jgi:hypothetical protein
VRKNPEMGRRHDVTQTNELAYSTAHQRAQEIQTFIQNLDLDILLISETHFTDRCYIKIPKDNVYSTNHPFNTAHGGTAIVINQTIKHHERAKYCFNNIQATSVTIELTMAAIYCPPRYNNKHVDYTNFLKTLGYHFLVGGDFNASEKDTERSNKYIDY